MGSIRNDCIKNDEHGIEILTEYCAGTLDSAAAANIDRHIAECVQCRELVEAQQSVWEMLDAWKPVEVSENFDARLYARIGQEQAAPTWRRWLGRILRPATPYAWWKPVVPVALAAGVLSVALLTRVPERVEPVGAKNTFASKAVSSAEEIDLQQVQQALDDIEVLAPSGPAGPSRL